MCARVVECLITDVRDRVVLASFTVDAKVTSTMKRMEEEDERREYPSPRSPSSSFVVFYDATPHKTTDTQRERERHTHKQKDRFVLEVSRLVQATELQSNPFLMLMKVRGVGRGTQRRKRRTTKKEKKSLVSYSPLPILTQHNPLCARQLWKDEKDLSGLSIHLAPSGRETLTFCFEGHAYSQLGLYTPSFSFPSSSLHEW